MNDQPCALYRFFTTDDVLLYVGVSLNPGARWKQHRADKPWWSEVATVTVETFPTRDVVLEAERTAIQAESPRYNVVHNNGRGVDRLRCEACSSWLPSNDTYYVINSDPPLRACKTCVSSSEKSTRLHQLAYPWCQDQWHDVWDHGLVARGMPFQVEKFMQSAEMPDDCHDICEPKGVIGMYFPFAWNDGEALYMCEAGHEWKCWWGNNYRGALRINAGLDQNPQPMPASRVVVL